MPFFQIGALLILLFLVSCASTSHITSQEVTAQSKGTDASKLTPVSPVQNTSSTRTEGTVDFDKINPVLIAQGAKFDIRFRTESSSNCRYTMQYPQVSGLADAALQAELNRSLRQNMIEQMGVTGTLLQGNRCPRDLRDAQNRPRLQTWTSRCETHFAQSRLVSIACSTLSLPGVYPYPRTHPVTFDLETGKIYQLAELFKPGSNYAVRMAVLMRDAWWQTGPGYISFPFERLETTADFDFYIQQDCDQVFQPYWKSEQYLSIDPFGVPPQVCMVIPNLGSGASRNYRMLVRTDELKEILDMSGALGVLAEKLDDRW